MVIFTKYAVLLKCICIMEASSIFPSTTTMIYTFTLTTLAYLLVLGVLVLSFCCSLLHSQGLNVLLQTSNKGLLMERPRLYAPLQTQCAMGRVHFQCKSVSPRVHSPENTLGHYTERTNRIRTEEDHAQFLMYFCCLLQNHTGKCFINGHKSENSCCMFES